MKVLCFLSSTSDAAGGFNLLGIPLISRKAVQEKICMLRLWTRAQVSLSEMIRA